jgi:peptidoglycan/xylan/chitin deacetylase (PgdA/CDA1 family)
VQKFLSDLEFFLQHFQPISLFQLLGYLKGEESLPKNPLLLSFDDGYRELYEIVFPILRQKGVPAVFFLNTDSLDNKELLFDNKRSLLREHLIQTKRLTRQIERELAEIDFAGRQALDDLCAQQGLDTRAYLRSTRPYLSSEQVAEMIAQGMAIGSHSIDHPPYFLLSLGEQVRQTAQSLQFLKEKFSINYSAFAFPGTDEGVGEDFFLRVAPMVDVSFGTSTGMVDPVRTHFQRTSFEYSDARAAGVLAERYGVELIRRMAGRNVVKRGLHTSR